MWKPVCCILAVAVAAYGTPITLVLYAANWEVTDPSTGQKASEKIEVKGKKPDMKIGDAYVKREISGTYKVVSAPGPIVNQGETWAVKVEPHLPDLLPWPTGNYKGHAVEQGGGTSVDGPVFTVP